MGVIVANLKGLLAATAGPAAIVATVGAVAVVAIRTGGDREAALRAGRHSIAETIAMETAYGRTPRPVSTASDGGRDADGVEEPEGFDLDTRRFETDGGAVTVMAGTGPGSPACRGVVPMRASADLDHSLCEARVLLETREGTTLSKGSACHGEGIVTRATLDGVDGRVVLTSTVGGIREPACTQVLHLHPPMRREASR